MSENVAAERTTNYIKQIKGSVLYKGGAVAASFLAIPIMISYLGAVQFGVWSTLLTIMSWVVFFDLGIGNGLRNKVAEALAKGQEALARSYISSAYSLIGFVAVGLWLVFLFFSYQLSWQHVFNTSAVSEDELRYSVQIAAAFMLLNFWVGLITALLGAVQKSALISLGQLVTNGFVLIISYVLYHFFDARISYLAWIYGIGALGGNFLLSVWFYNTYKYLRPGYSLDREHLIPLLSVGVRFFIIQLAVLVVFTTDKVLITQLFGPEYVTEYEVVFKLFSVVAFLHTLISSPLWSAYTDAYHREDAGWIVKMLRTQLKLYGLVVIGLCVLAIVAQFIIGIWIDRAFVVSMPLVISVAAFVAVSTWNNIFAIMLNGAGAVNVQLYTALAAMLLNIPLALLMVKVLGMGVEGVVFAATLSLLFSAVLLPLQVYRLTRTVKSDVTLT
ncbi:oligosaccharide flippase family protein [Pseudomonas extremorientalis]|uniref:Na+-driven multidrug efflux pump n=1 Tax=Pseudomonas extremorientalis TaxID=169669 RepID=A0A1H0W101_9PSED|nr:oligosaccharide flippase family protein [Pseudomonas extremorientalis]KAB0518349.1 polysaccharide biosynthesis protein [Pseudomonas extremorientalis]OIN11867.1 polysaccharide biosynthesis protein [Pseudomonas extremorientalis]SDP84185.1 Na+-driven multidrug efflux pump [Pseudomonas extremorientalis]